MEVETSRNRIFDLLRHISQVFLILFAMVLLFTGLSYILLNYIYIQKELVATICTAAALATSAIIVFLTFQHNRKINQEPWFLYIREFHKDFWSSADYVKVRKWICSKEAYDQELLPILKARQNGEVGSDEYQYLEDIDRFFSIMARVIYIDTTTMTEEQLEAWEKMGLLYWLDRIKLRKELVNYAKDYWPRLYEHIDGVSSSLSLRGYEVKKRKI